MIAPVDVEHYLKATNALRRSHDALLHGRIDEARALTKDAIDASLKFWKSLKAAEGGRES